MIAKDTESEKSIITKLEETWYNELFSSRKNVGLRKVIYYHCRKMPYLQKEEPYVWVDDFKKDISKWFDNKTMFKGKNITFLIPMDLNIVINNELVKFKVRDFNFILSAWDKFAINKDTFTLNFNIEPAEETRHKPQYEYFIKHTLWPIPIDFTFSTDIIKSYNIPKTYKEYKEIIKLLAV